MSRKGIQALSEIGTLEVNAYTGVTYFTQEISPGLCEEALYASTIHQLLACNIYNKIGKIILSPYEDTSDGFSIKVEYQFPIGDVELLDMDFLSLVTKEISLIHNVIEEHKRKIRQVVQDAIRKATKANAEDRPVNLDTIEKELRGDTDETNRTE